MIEKANGDTGKAIGDLDQAIKRDPRPADVYLLRADLHKKKGENDLALADLDAALSARARRCRQPAGAGPDQASQRRHDRGYCRLRRRDQARAR